MATILITYAGVELQRKGDCTSCEGCRDECLECPHGTLKDGKQFCTIYADRGKYCEECSKIRSYDVYHQGCIDFPEHPMVLRVRKGICAYTFSRTDHLSMDDLPGLDEGETYDKSGG